MPGIVLNTVDVFMQLTNNSMKEILLLPQVLDEDTETPNN